MTIPTATVDDLLGRRSDALSFELGRNLHGAFGGAFGGVVAAAALRAARDGAPGRTPASLDIRFLRGLPRRYRAGRGGWQEPRGVEIPILSTLRPRMLGSGGSRFATGLLVPWTSGGASAEAACLAADMCVGPPVAAACAGRWIPHPNPDLSLRFVGEVTGPDVIGVGRLERVSGGLAIVGITVWSEREIVAVGVCSSMLLDTVGR